MQPEDREAQCVFAKHRGGVLDTMEWEEQTGAVVAI